MAEIDALHGRRPDAEQVLQKVSIQQKWGELVIPAARALAMSGKYEEAHNVLREHPDIAKGDSEPYSAAVDFIDGLKSMQDDDGSSAVDQLSDSFNGDETPESAYFLAKAEMKQQDWPAAIKSLNYILEHKGNVVIDGVASMIPWPSMPSASAIVR